ncbi:MAG: helix-turn-helix domain-containing protein [Vicinamibacteraceae bacterium]
MNARGGKLVLKQQAVADAARINRLYLSRTERGTENVSILTLVSIADALDTPAQPALRLNHR